MVCAVFLSILLLIFKDTLFGLNTWSSLKMGKIGLIATHDNVRYQTETFSALLALYVGNSPVTGEFPAQKPVTRSFFFDNCVWINDWVNNREAGDLRRHRGHLDVNVMTSFHTQKCPNPNGCREERMPIKPASIHSQASNVCRCLCTGKYRQISNIKRTYFQNLNVSRLVLQFLLPNPLRPDLRGWRCNVSWSSADRRCSNYIWMINNYIA